ncbi:FecR family protein [Chitinophaga sancti]|uniref:FecR family protein n=1 Tax=Chitinophaga sancti TaxID=1004 RepID=A0A1K1M2G6_9BACT|nr:FecR family protein [Chitinophaga sancti]WQD64683.1 FecR family protein [Chitinophaga sancti]WQG89695.1 FecR family protein [Chitinophaga sancti]SFW17340.1 FecR family protein [Chitinophaga sancti]
MEQSINDELLTRYLANEANASECALVESWMAESETNRQYLDTLHQAWQLAAARPLLEMDMEEKWRQFRHARKKKVSIKRPLAIFAAAAAICLLIITSWQWLNRQVANRISETNTGTHPAHDSLHYATNTSGKAMPLTLPDGTHLLLADQSALTWREPFLSSRAISMTGKAFFQVSKNGQHPFIVISGDISTTVLGTDFEINTFHDISVRLYSGKVMIASSNTGRMKNKVYLAPGQEFIYGPQIIVRSFLQQVPSVTKDSHPAEDPYIANGEENNWYMFNNQSLEEVLNQLEAIYKVRIIYNKADIKNIYFTARYERTESLTSILKRIAKLNDLKITDNDSVMIIKK